MKKIVVLILLILFNLSIVNATELPDIENHWAKESIYRLIKNDAINGYEDSTFKPDNNITIAEFLKILVQYTDYQKVLIGERWPDWYINTAKYYKFILDDEFENYDNYITRNEVAEILGRFINISDIKVNKNFFIDTSSEIVSRLASLGVVNGYEDNTFRGENLISRAEACTIICRAMNTRREIVANKNYDIKDAEKLTNTGRNPCYDSNYTNRYEIKNNKIYFYDTGRYAKLDGYTIEDKSIDNAKLIKLIKALIQEDAYVGVSYIPDEHTVDQITINYGKREGYVYNHSYTFGFAFYNDKPFELRRISMNDSLSEKCFMKINISKMWKDVYDMENGEYSHKLNNEKLLKALKVIFDNSTATNIYNYVQELIPKTFEAGVGKSFDEVRKFGKYEVNFHTTNSKVELYISK